LNRLIGMLIHCIDTKIIRQAAHFFFLADDMISYVTDDLNRGAKHLKPLIRGEF
jgi:hypothetical protein